jgi:hypothetical protein
MTDTNRRGGIIGPSWVAQFLARVSPLQLRGRIVMVGEQPIDEPTDACRATINVRHSHPDPAPGRDGNQELVFDKLANQVSPFFPTMDRVERVAASGSPL